MALKMEHVSFTYAEGLDFAQPALTDVSLELASGELLLVVGATGTGKSTLLRIAAGLAEPTRGSVTMDGELPGAEPGRVGILFQNAENQLFGETLLEDVAFGPRNLGAGDDDARSISERALGRVGLPPELFSARSPFSLSGGEARRAAMAGVLAMEPRYFLLDEPTAGLDPGGTDAIVGIVAEAKADAGVMIVTHDPDDFLPIADSVLVLAGGAVAFRGTPEEMLAAGDVIEAAGLSLPQVAVAQVLAYRRAGLEPSRLTLDPVAAAHRVLAARGHR